MRGSYYLWLLLLICMLASVLRTAQGLAGSTTTTTIRNKTRTRMASSSSPSTATRLSTMAHLLERDGKRVAQASWKTFFVTSAIIPVWATTVLPLSIAYQAGSAAIRAVLPATKKPSKASSSALADLDSGYVVDPSQIIERSARKYDIVVLGATGFTGYLAALHLAKTYGADGAGKGVKWAIAGRNKEKLAAVKQRLAKELSNDDLLNVDVIECDTSIPATLPKLVEQTRVVATTAGPYTLYGSSVVEFCAKFGTHYVDITGEVDWVKAMLCQWQETAQKTGARLIPFCGHDSIPWDISYLKLQQLLGDECNDKLKTITFWDAMRGEAPGGTFATILNSVTGDSHRPPKMDFDPFLRLPDGTKSKYVCKSDLPTFPVKAESNGIELTSGKNKHQQQPWASPFIMAMVNSQVVRWTHALIGQGSTSVTYKETAVDPDFKTAFVNYMGVAMAGSMLFNPITLHFLKTKMTKLGEGPSMEAMEKKRESSIVCSEKYPGIY